MERIGPGSSFQVDLSCLSFLSLESFRLWLPGYEERELQVDVVAEYLSNLSATDEFVRMIFKAKFSRDFLFKQKNKLYTEANKALTKDGQ